jgi:peroxiredoxin
MKPQNMQPSIQKIFSAIVLALGAIWIIISAAPEGSTTAGAIPAPRAGFLAPNFTLETLNGDSITLSDLKGKAVIVNIWATWCPPCRAEMPALQSLHEDYQDQELIILAINSTIQDDESQIDPFAQEFGLTFPILLDRNGDTTRAYNITSLPSTFFIGKDGIIREVVIGGPMSEALLRTRADALIKEP